VQLDHDGATHGSITYRRWSSPIVAIFLPLAIRRCRSVSR